MRNSHYGDKKIWRQSYLHNEISYTGETTSLYWIRARLSSNLCLPGKHIDVSNLNEGQSSTNQYTGMD